MLVRSENNINCSLTNNAILNITIATTLNFISVPTIGVYNINLYIYNFFPTIQGASIVRSRQIAREKMFMIHNTLGEDAKVFEVDRARPLFTRGRSFTRHLVTTPPSPLAKGQTSGIVTEVTLEAKTLTGRDLLSSSRGR